MKRQDMIEKDSKYSKIVVFPEGRTTNGTYMLDFKKGAFAALKPVIPSYIKYDFSMVSPAYEILPILS